MRYMNKTWARLSVINSASLIVCFFRQFIVTKKYIIRLGMLSIKKWDQLWSVERRLVMFGYRQFFTPPPATPPCWHPTPSSSCFLFYFFGRGRVRCYCWILKFVKILLLMFFVYFYLKLFSDLYETDSGQLRDVRLCLVTGSFLPPPSTTPLTLHPLVPPVFFSPSPPHPSPTSSIFFSPTIF